jgi:hypothetical protein
MSKKQQEKTWNAKAKVVRLDQIKREINELKAKGDEQYKPKYGRQIAKLEKQYKKMAA